MINKKPPTKANPVQPRYSPTRTRIIEETVWGDIVTINGQDRTICEDETVLTGIICTANSFTMTGVGTCFTGELEAGDIISSVNTLTNGSPSTWSSGSTSFTVSEPCSNIYQTTYSGGTQDTYQVTVKFYRDCDGIPAPGSMSLTYSSASCGVSSSVSLYQVGPAVVITPICPTMNSTCTGGSIIGIEEYTYEAIISLPKLKGNPFKRFPFRSTA